MVLIRNPNNDYIRQLIWTAEEGEKGTPHIQAYLKLIKQQRMSFVKKLYPGGHYKPISAADYIRNAVDYAQKEDETTTGAHVNTLCDTIADPVYLLNRLIRAVLDDKLPADNEMDAPDIGAFLRGIPTTADPPTTFKERLRLWINDQELVLARERPSVCKLLVSAQYNKIKQDYSAVLLEYNIEKYIQQRDANDNEGQGTGESELHEAESISGTSQEGDEEEGDEGSSVEGSDSSGAEDSGEASGDEACY